MYFFFFGKIINSASAFAVAMDQWTGVHRAFIIRAYYRNNDSISTAQRMFKKQFSIYQVPPCNVIKSWLRHFECTGSSQAGGCASRSSIPVSKRNAQIIIICIYSIYYYTLSFLANLLHHLQSVPEQREELQQFPEDMIQFTL